MRDGRTIAILTAGASIRHINVTPNSIRLKSNVKGTTAQKITHQAAKKLTKLRIGQHWFTIEKLQVKKVEIEDHLSKQPSTKDQQEIDSFTARVQCYVLETSKARQREKFSRLVEKNHSQRTSANARK